MTTRSLKIYATVMTVAASLTLGACSYASPDSQPTKTGQSTIEPTPWAELELQERDFSGIKAIPNPDSKAVPAFYANADNCRVKIEVHNENKLVLILPDGKTMEEPTLHKVRQEPAFVSCSQDPSTSSVIESPPASNDALMEPIPYPNW